MEAPMPVRASKLLLLSGLLGTALLPCQARAADAPPAIASPTGTYSSLAFNEESGDLGGYEIQILPSSRGMQLVLQIAEGELVEVVVADASRAGGSINATFDLPGSPGCTLSARMEASSLVVTFDFGNGVRDTATLARSVGYWDGGAARR